jgi:thiosulfate/3-mercaptopyruvate sulfurtransferase
MNADSKGRGRWLVSIPWLAENLGDPNLVIVDGSYYLPAMKRDARAEYLAGHIPGAVFFDIDEIADHSNRLPHMLPDAETFAKHMARLGIGDGMKIVVYDGGGLFSAPRVWWTLRLFGAIDVKILDGGFPQWRAELRPIESGTVTRPPARFTPRFDQKQVADMAKVEAALHTGSAQVVDARSAERFRGEAAEPRQGVRSGRMPGSKNVPVAGVVENDRLASPEKIKAAFAEGGVDPDQPIITSCGSGVTAATLWLALDAIGKPPQALYDGSWTEWGSLPDKPIKTGD